MSKGKFMRTVFLSGSRSINDLDAYIRIYVCRIIEENVNILIGDANGVDKELQKFLHEKNYSNVTVFHSGSNCRNNVGNWETHEVDVNPKLKGRSFYTAKDKVMVEYADYGFVIWDGKSKGSLANVSELIKNNKPSTVFLVPKKKFIYIEKHEDMKLLFN